MKSVIQFIDMDREELNQLVERARTSLAAEDYRKVKGMAEALTYLTDVVADQQTTIGDLRELMFPASTEKTAAVLKNAGVAPTANASEKITGGKPETQKPKPPGHGRNGADAYRQAQRIQVQHATLQHGDRCPGCQKGKVYEQQEPRQLVRIVGQAPLTATIYALQTLRCNLCGEIYSADVPEGVGEDKYEESACRHDCAAEIWQRHAFLSTTRSGKQSGNPIAGVHAMGDRGGGGGADQACAR